MLTLYTSPTPNGHKVSILLEELEVPYEVHEIDLGKKDQHQPEFLAINPNGRIPAMVDDGFAVFETGAMMIYLAEKHGRFLPTDVHGRSEVIQWLMFQMAGIGPMMGQANVFNRYFPERLPAVIERYQNESRRLFEVLEGRLDGRDFLCGDYSIADMASWAWVRHHEWAGVPIDGLGRLQDWLVRIGERPAVQRGISVPGGRRIDPEEMLEAAKSMVTQ